MTNEKTADGEQWALDQMTAQDATPDATIEAEGYFNVLMLDPPVEERLGKKSQVSISPEGVLSVHNVTSGELERAYSPAGWVRLRRVNP